MKSILCFELKRCFGSKRLYLSLLTGIVISLLHIIFGVLPLTQWLSSWQGDFFLTPHSAYGHWIGMDSSTVWPTLLYMLLPFLCAFPFSDTVSWDFSTGYVMQIFVRRKKSAYLFAKALTIFIASAFLTATILFFDFAGTALYLPLVRPEALTNLYGISNRSLMAHLFYHKPLQYTVIYIIMDALLVGAWEIIALAVSVATRNPLQPALFPFLLYLILYFICNWLQMDSVSLFAIGRARHAEPDRRRVAAFGLCDPVHGADHAGQPFQPAARRHPAELCAVLCGLGFVHDLRVCL